MPSYTVTVVDVDDVTVELNVDHGDQIIDLITTEKVTDGQVQLMARVTIADALNLIRELTHAVEIALANGATMND